MKSCLSKSLLHLPSFYPANSCFFPLLGLSVLCKFMKNFTSLLLSDAIHCLQVPMKMSVSEVHPTRGVQVKHDGYLNSQQARNLDGERLFIPPCTIRYSLHFLECLEHNFFWVAASCFMQKSSHFDILSAFLY